MGVFLTMGQNHLTSLEAEDGRAMIRQISQAQEATTGEQRDLGMI